MSEEIPAEIIEQLKNRIINFEKNNERSYEKRSSNAIADDIINEIEKAIKK